MTTYGTIPSEQPGSSSSSTAANLIIRAKDQINATFGRPRSWKEMIQVHSIKLPSNVFQCLERVGANAAFYRTNYLMIIVSLLLLSLLWHPTSLVSLVVVVILWLYLYFLREDQDRPFRVIGQEIDSSMVMMFLLVVTVAVLLFTDVINNVFVGVSFGVVAVLVHGILRKTDDLVFVEDVERAGGGASRLISPR